MNAYGRMPREGTPSMHRNEGSGRDAARPHHARPSRHAIGGSILAGFDPSTLRSDVVAGVAVSAIVVPQSMAYAQIAGLPPQAGIFVSFAAPLAYALLGSSRQLICGPSSATAAISAAHVAALATGVADFAALSAALAVLSGLIFVVLGLLRLGFVSQYISSAVQIGFLFGLGLTIIVGQIYTMLGIEHGGGSFFEQVWRLMLYAGDAHGWTLAIGAASLALVLGLGRFAPAFPAALLTVALSIVVVSAFGLAERGVAVIGQIDRTIPTLAIPAVAPDRWLALLPAALAVVFIGSSESITIARQYANRHRYEVRPNQEFLALGASGIASGLFHGFVTSGGASQSAANDRAGAKSQASSVVLSVMALLTAVVLLPLIANLPLAVLAAIVINAVLGFVDVPAMRRVWQIGLPSFAVALVALAGVLAIGILNGLAFAVVLSIFWLLIEFSRPRITEVAALPGSSAFVSAAAHPEAATPPGLITLRPEAALLFINAEWVREGVQQRIASASAPPRVVAIDLEESPYLSYTGIEALFSLRQSADDAGVTLWLTNVHERAETALRRAGFQPPNGPRTIFASHRDAVAAFGRLEPMPTDREETGR